MSPRPPSRERRWLAVLLAAFAALCALYNVTLPLFEASDEAAHFAYADYLARERRLPDLRNDLPSHEVFQPALYYAALAPLIAPFDRSGLADLSRLNPDWFDPQVNPDYWQVANLHGHTSSEDWPWSGTVWAVHFARAFSTLLGALTVALAWWTARRLGAPALLAAALVAFNPKFIHLSSVVSNDIAVTLAATAACAWMVRMMTDPRAERARRWAALGALVGIAALCKIQALGLLVPAAFVVAARAPARRWPAAAAAVLAGFLAVSGWWLAWNTVQYGDPLAWSQVQRANAALMRVPALGVAGVLARVPRLFTSFWGVLGIEKYFPSWIDIVMAAGLCLAVAGCARRVAGWLAAGGLARAHAAAALPLWLWQLVSLGLFLSWMQTHVGTENSRLLMPGVAGIAILVALGWDALVPPHWRARMHVAAAGGLAALAVAAPFVVILPAFAAPAPIPREALARLAPQGVNLEIAGQIRLWHAQVEPRVVKPGDAARITLYWGAEGIRIPASYRILLEAVNADGELVARRRFIPYGGRFPTTAWRQAEIFADPYSLPIDADAGRGPVTIQLGLVFPDDASTLLPLAGDARKLALGTLKIDAPANEPAGPATPLVASFGGAIQLDGYTAVLQPGGPLRLALHFRGLAPPDRAGLGSDATLFVHVLDGAGNLLAQVDGPPLGGRNPTRWWDRDDRIVETRDVALPDAAARVQIGWYDPGTGIRLPATRPDGGLWKDAAVVVWQRSVP